MTKPPVLTNRKPADELSWIREQIKDLKGREDYIRRMMLEGKMDHIGDDFEAFVQTQNRKTFDRKAAEEEFGDLSRFDKVSEFSLLKLKRIDKKTIDDLEWDE